MWHSHSFRVKQHLAAFIKWLNILNSSCLYLQRPWRLILLSFLSKPVSIRICHPACIYELSIAMSKCKITDVLRAVLDGLSGAFNQCWFLFSIPVHKSLPFWATYNAFVQNAVTEAVVILSNIIPRGWLSIKGLQKRTLGITEQETGSQCRM